MQDGRGMDGERRRAATRKIMGPHAGLTLSPLRLICLPPPKVRNKKRGGGGLGPLCPNEKRVMFKHLFISLFSHNVTRVFPRGREGRR